MDNWDDRKRSTHRMENTSKWLPTLPVACSISRTDSQKFPRVHAFKDAAFPRMYIPCCALDSRTLPRFLVPKKPMRPLLLFLTRERIIIFDSSPYSICIAPSLTHHKIEFLKHLISVANQVIRHDNIDATVVHFIFLCIHWVL